MQICRYQWRRVVWRTRSKTRYSAQIKRYLRGTRYNQFMRVLAEQHLCVSALLTEKKIKTTWVFNVLYGGHIEKLNDICEQLRPGRGMVWWGQLNSIRLSLIYRFHCIFVKKIIFILFLYIFYSLRLLWPFLLSQCPPQLHSRYLLHTCTIFVLFITLVHSFPVIPLILSK